MKENKVVEIENTFCINIEEKRVLEREKVITQFLGEALQLYLLWLWGLRGFRVGAEFENSQSNSKR